MLIDLVHKFQAAVEENPTLVLDNYKLKDGVYIKLDVTKTFEDNVQNIEQRVYVHSNKEDEVIQNRELYDWFKIRDFYSAMLNDDANKLIDLPQKKIHSTNPLVFFMKEDLLLGEKKIYTSKQLAVRLEQFYEVLQKSSSKFLESYPTATKSKELKSKMMEEREVFFQTYYPHLMAVLQDGERVAKNNEYKDFLIGNMDVLIDLFQQLKDKYGFKNYIKVFFEADEETYQTEYELYLLPRIFTVDAYNYADTSSIVGLPSGDMTVNSKKPFLLLKTLKTNVPLRIPVEEAITRKDLYKWLEMQGKFKELSFFTDTIFTSDSEKNKAKYHLRVDKNGSIDYYENVPFTVSDKLDGFYYENVLDVGETVEKVFVSSPSYHVETPEQLKMLMSKYFFRGRMNGTILTNEPEVKTNEFTNNMVTYFLGSRQALYDFFEKGTSENLRVIIDSLTRHLIEEQLYRTVEGTKTRRLAEAFNLRLALLKYFQVKGGEEMGDYIQDISASVKAKIRSKDLVVCANDQEFYYVAGQLGYYLLSQSQAKSKTIGMFEPILRAKQSHQIKRRLEDLMFTYGHAISAGNNSFRNAMAMVMGYEAEEKCEGKQKDMLLAGLLANNMFYEKQEKGAVEHEQMV